MKKIFVTFLLLITWFSLSRAGSVYDYGQLTGTPSDGTITYIAYKTAAGDNEILTEDGYNTSIGTDQGYQNKYWLLSVENFTTHNNGDAITILFTGIQTETGKSGTANFTWDNTVASTDHGTITFGSSSNPAVPTGLSASVLSPGHVRLTWNTVSGLTYRVYRSSQASGAGNGHSNGRYTRLATGVTPPYTDDSSPQTGVWYLIVAEDGSGNWSGHTEEVYADASLPVKLMSFTAEIQKKRVYIAWKTASEVNNLGFNIFRSEVKSGPYAKINPKLIAGRKSATQAKEYSFVDQNVQMGCDYFYKLEQIDLAGTRHYFGPLTVHVFNSKMLIPKKFQLKQNFPNPFNPETTIEYDLPRAEQVSLEIYDLLGKSIAVLVQKKQAAGRHRVLWKGRLTSGLAAPSGIYVCKLRAGDFVAVKKMLLLR